MGLIKVKHRGLLDGPATVAQIVREVMAVSDVPEIAHLDVKTRAYANCPKPRVRGPATRSPRLRTAVRSRRPTDCPRRSTR